MSNQAKLIRGQIRQIIKEVLPEMMGAEVKAAIYKDISQKLQLQLTNVEQQIKDTLAKLDDRQKDIQNYIVRQSMLTSNPADVLLVTPSAEPAKSE